MAQPRGKPLLIYDGDCGFCRRRVERWKALTGDRIEYAPFQEAAAQFPEISPEQLAGSVWFVDATGEIASGAEAVFRTLACAPGRGGWLWAYRRIPGAALLSEWGYRFVAEHRMSFSPADSCESGPPASRVITRWIFLKWLALIYLAAFFSLWRQIDGLIGPGGILPVSDLLEAARRQLGPERYLLFPTLCWINPGGRFLHLLCGGGVLLSLLLFLGILPAACLFLLWGFYLSLTVAGQDFMTFQWDILLLEAGFLAIFLAPLTLRSRIFGDWPPSKTVVWLFRWLAFRLIFSSGAVKLASGDPAWRNLTALTFHYETQPLPTWTSWAVHQLPAWFHQLSAAGMFGFELAVPCLFFCPRRWRFLGAGLSIGFQMLIIATGNYCFFNWLTIGLCLLLFDDALWVRRWPQIFSRDLKREGGKGKGWPAWVIAPLAGLALFMTGFQMLGLSRVSWPWPRPVVELAQLLAPFRTFNGYGLFAVMTTSRPEIIVEGSREGAAWLPYEFKYKPGDPKRGPEFTGPHQPRLDWQMWFAALSRCRDNPWFIQFCVRLLEGSPPVVGLMGKNPFPGKPPRYIRAVVYDYRFTDFSTRRATGNWWRRQPKGLYCPVLSLREEPHSP